MAGLDRERDGPDARRAPGRSGVPSTWLTRVRWAEWRGRTAARVRPGLAGARPPRGRPGLVGIPRGAGAPPPRSAVVIARGPGHRGGTCTVGAPGRPEPRGR